MFGIVTTRIYLLCHIGTTCRLSTGYRDASISHKTSPSHCCNACLSSSTLFDFVVLGEQFLKQDAILSINQRKLAKRNRLHTLAYHTPMRSFSSPVQSESEADPAASSSSPSSFRRPSLRTYSSCWRIAFAPAARGVQVSAGFLP